MSDPRDDLVELARLVSAHLDWQRELGTSALALPDDVLSAPRVTRRKLTDAAVIDANRPARDAATSAQPAGSRLEMPAFMRKKPSESRPTPGPLSRPEAVVPTVAKTFALPSSAVEVTMTAAPMASPPAPVEPRSTAPSVVPADAASLTPAERVKRLVVLENQVADCQRCRLHEGRTQTVFARGNPGAPIAFVGEGPGRDEDLQGFPFVGAAGQLLDKIIGAMGLTPEDYYICNVVKCRPPNNRVPAPDEMEACGSYLATQLGLVRPQLIVALGKTAVGYLLRNNDAMSKLRGRWHEWQGIPMLATWHPAYLLRQPSAKKDTWDDMKIVLERLGRPVPKR